MIPLPSLTGGRSREHSRLAKASVENIIIIMLHDVQGVALAREKLADSIDGVGQF